MPAKKMTSKPKGTKIQPAIETLTFSTPSLDPGYNGRFYIDLAKAASVANRRLYRQGRQWMVAGFTFLSSGTGAIAVSKLPQTWLVSNAWEKTFRAWDKQQKEAVSKAGAQSTVAAFRDFKISIDDTHRGYVGTNRDLLPIDSAGNQYNLGEWNLSEITIPNAGGPGVAVDYNLVMLGPDGANTRAMIRGYQTSRARVEATTPDENDPQNSFFSDMFDVGSQDDNVIANATDNNDDSPYDRTNYPGTAFNAGATQIQSYANIIDTSAGVALGIDVARSPGGMFPCGLVAIDWTETSNAANLIIQVHLVPGNYRGYLAPPMTEM